MKIIKNCSICKVTHIIEVKDEDFDKWTHGELIQNAFPYLNIDQRELLISGLCGHCFDAFIKGE